MGISVTIIIPILNAMPYLTEALASLDAQTFKDFEVCLWDNGSADGSAEEARRWIPARLKGRVVSGNPLPLHECLAQMVQDARTEFIARMDGDDVCLPERFEKQIQYLNQNPDVAVLGAQCLPIDARGIQLDEQLHFPESFVGILSKFMIGNAVLHPSVCFRKSSILEAGNYKLYEKPCEDLDLWLRVASVYEIRSLPDPLLKYRLHESSVTGKAKHAQLLENHVLNCLKRHTQNLFEIDPEDYERLRSKRYIPAAIPILKAAKCIQARCGIPIGEVLRQSDFIWSARCLTARIDLFSRFCYSVLGRCYLR
jgi:glycosyltransferase involved in cell wall biosynthesis